MIQNRWGIVMTAREPGDLVLANVAYHLGLGATAVHVYLDDPADPAAARLAQLPGAHVTCCDDAHWAALARGRPAGQNRRQGLNATQAYRRGGVDWLIHLDADEFIRLTGDFAAELTAFPRDYGYLSILPRERCHIGRAAPRGLFDGGFRHPARVPPRLHRALYGRAAEFLDSGMSSHPSGKAATPTGFDYSIRIHRPRATGQDRLPAHSTLAAQSAELLHFDGLTPLHWLLKLLRYAEYDDETMKGMNPAHRIFQIAELVGRGASLGDALALHDRVMGMSPAKADQLAALGLFDRTAFDPMPQIARVQTGPPPDLTAAGFDAALIAAHRDTTNPAIAALLAAWPGPA